MCSYPLGLSPWSPPPLQYALHNLPNPSLNAPHVLAPYQNPNKHLQAAHQTVQAAACGACHGTTVKPAGQQPVTVSGTLAVVLMLACSPLLGCTRATVVTCSRGPTGSRASG